MIVNDASTINVIDDASLALDSIVNYDRKWRYNLEHHFDDTRRVNYDRNTFIIQATVSSKSVSLSFCSYVFGNLNTRASKNSEPNFDFWSRT